MNPKSVRTLAWLAGVLLLVAAMIPAPVATVAISALAVVVAIAPVVSGSTKLRIAALLVLLASLWLAVATFPHARNEMATYRAHATR